MDTVGALECEYTFLTNCVLHLFRKLSLYSDSQSLACIWLLSCNLRLICFACLFLSRWPRCNKFPRSPQISQGASDFQGGIMADSLNFYFFAVYLWPYIVLVSGTACKCNVPLWAHAVEVLFIEGFCSVKQAVPIRDPVILSKIHQTYRIGYIKVSVMSYLSLRCVEIGNSVGGEAGDTFGPLTGDALKEPVLLYK